MIDFYGERKLAYYAIKRESGPLCLGINRTTPELKALKSAPKQELGPPHDLTFKKHICDIWAVNMTLDATTATVEVRLFDISTGEQLQERVLGPSTFEPNCSTELAEDYSVNSTTAVQAKMLDENGNVIARMSDWPQPLKHVILPQSYDIKLTVLEGKVEIRTNAPVKGVEVYMADDTRDVQWDDNGVDVFPGDVHVIKGYGIKKGDDLRIRYYGMGTSRLARPTQET